MPLFTSDLELSDDYPTIEPSLRLDFANARALDPIITFTRASTATYVGRNGLIETAGVDEARFDHDPTTGESLGLLIEEPRTNILGLSSDLTDNNGNDWDAVNGTIAVNQTTAPDGTTTAASFTTTAGNAEHSVVFAELVPTGDVTASIWVKTNTYSIVSFVLYGEPNSLVSYNINTKTVYNQLSNVSRATIKEYPNGWYRISATMNCTVAASRAFRLFASTGNFDASGTESFYYWGPQVEAGSFETSYIPTVTSNTAVTRAVDQAYILGDNVPLGSGVDEYSFYVRGRLLDTQSYLGISRGLVGMGSSSSNRIRIPHNNAGFVEVYSGGSKVAELFTSNIGTTERKIALAVKKDDFAMSMDGGTVQTDTSGNIPTFINDIALGCSTYDPSPLNYPSTSYIKEFRIYPKRLTNAQLQTLTQ